MLWAVGCSAGRGLVSRAAMLASAPCIEVPALQCTHKHTSPLAVEHKQQYHSEHVTTVHLQGSVALTKDVLKYEEATSSKVGVPAIHIAHAAASINRGY